VSLHSFNSVDVAELARDNLACELYRQLVAWLVAQVNSQLKSDASSDRVRTPQPVRLLCADLWIQALMVVDMPGFAAQSCNQLHQLCANMAYEQLQVRLPSVTLHRGADIVE
jgi:myosin heavy subunit